MLTADIESDREIGQVVESAFSLEEEEDQWVCRVKGGGVGQSTS